MGNSARVSTGAAPGAGLFAWQDRQAQAMVFSVGIKDASAGFEGASDGYQDLHGDFRMDWHFETATNGNVTDVAWLDLPDLAVIVREALDVMKPQAEKKRIVLSDSLAPVMHEVLEGWWNAGRWIVRDDKFPVRVPEICFYAEAIRNCRLKRGGLIALG